MVKAWETKVFPTIRRRFRNEAERKSGLDQIKGALQLGMAKFLPVLIVPCDVQDNICFVLLTVFEAGK